MTTSSNLIPFCDIAIVKGHVSSSIFFCTPLRILGESHKVQMNQCVRHMHTICTQKSRYSKARQLQEQWTAMFAMVASSVLLAIVNDFTVRQHQYTQSCLTVQAMCYGVKSICSIVYSLWP